MFFRQILHEDLGCASYIIAARGEAVVVDPKWEIGEYLHAAEEADAKICHVLETHFHADHVSGRRRLSDATGAVSHVPVDPQRPDAGGLRDGDVLVVGCLHVCVIAAPGHRPEHLAYLVCDRGSDRVPCFCPATRCWSGISPVLTWLSIPSQALARCGDGATPGRAGRPG